MWWGQHNTHQQMFSQTVNTLKISGDLRINVLLDASYKHSCSTSWSSLSALQMLWLCLLCLRLPSARFLIRYLVSRDDVQIVHAFVLWVPPKHQDFWFAIGPAPMFFRADSVTLNTPHTTGKSDEIIFRSTKIIGTLPRIVGRGGISPIILWCVPSVSYSHTTQKCNLVCF